MRHIRMIIVSLTLIYGASLLMYWRGVDLSVDGIRGYQTGLLPMIAAVLIVIIVTVIYKKERSGVVIALAACVLIVMELIYLLMWSGSISSTWSLSFVVRHMHMGAIVSLVAACALLIAGIMQCLRRVDNKVSQAE